jgi:hypothetical protein
MALAAALATAIGVLMAVANLLPVRSPSSTLDSDGLHVLRWVLHPRVTAAASSVDRTQLDKIIEETHHPLVLLAAVFRRRQIDSGYPQFVPMAERLNAIAHDERTKPAHRGAIAAQLAVTFGASYLHMGIVQGKAIDRANADELIEIAELGYRLRPEDERVRIGLAIVRLLDHRPAEARQVLARLRPATPETHAVATQLFAIAEIYLGNRDRAGAILARLGDGDPVMAQIVSALSSSWELPALVSDGADDHGAGGSQSATADSVVSSDENPPASAASAASPETDSVGADPVIATSSPEGSTPPRP